MGTPLGMGACIDKKGTTKSQSQVTGYTIVQAKDIEQQKLWSLTILT